MKARGRAPARRRSEHLEQVQLVSMVHAFHPDVLVYAVPNGARRSRRQGARLRDEGMLAGVPDLVFAEPRGRFHGLYVEMKRASGGKVSDAQRRVIKKLRRRGYAVLVADEGVDQAYADVVAYLERGEVPGARLLG